MAITKVRQLRKSIEKLTRWETSGKAFGFIETVSNEKCNYIYEFFCAMRVLKDLHANHKINLLPGKKGYKFTMSPGKKKEWARFVITESKTSNKELFELCLGVEIRISSSPKTTFAADISIQNSNTDDPDESHTVLIMDAKYKKSSESTLDISTIREFAQCVRDLQVPKNISNLKFDKLAVLNSNCLFTNGELVDDHEEYCKNNNLKQVGRFDCDNRQMKVVG